MPRLRTAGFGVAVATMVALAVPSPASPATAADSGGLPERAVKQIEALARAKAARTSVQRKISSELLTERRQRSGGTAATGVPRVRTGVQLDAKGRAKVEILGPASARVLGRIKALGGAVTATTKGAAELTAALPVSAVEALAALPEVRAVRPAADYLTHRIKPPAPSSPAKAAEQKQAKENARRARVASVLAQAAELPTAGSVVSEGDRVLAADTARTRFRVTGVGAKVCVLSDGVDSLAASQATGDLPADVDVLPGQAGSGDEGTAMLEIIHDVAPGAPLGFATAIISDASFAQNIRNLRASGCAVIVDDILYFSESPFQDGVIARAVADVTSDGALYFSSAGNEGNLNDNSSGVWEGDFVDSGQVLGKLAGTLHDFAPGDAVQTLNPMSAGSDGDPVTLFWADPLGAAGNDYDLYVVDSSGGVAAFSNDYQTGTQDPYELTFVPATGARYSIAVVKFRGAERFLHVSVLRGRFRPNGALAAFATDGQTRGHSAVPAAYSVAAVPAKDALPVVLDPGDAPSAPGPYPEVYARTQPSEVFTSNGPRRVFFAPDGAPLTPGNFSSTGGEVRAKPDITSADGVATTLADFAPFFGTSAAAPHAAGIAALVVSGNPGIGAAEVRSAMVARPIDIEARGPDRDTGVGIVMADRVLRQTGATPQPLVVADQPTVTPTTGDGDEFLEPGESGAMALPLTNIGDGRATGVSAAVQSPTPGVVITPSQRSYGNIARGATVTRDFTIALAADYETGRPVAVDVRITFVGYLSPTRDTLSLPTGQPSDAVVDFAYAGAPVAIPDANPAGVVVPLEVSGLGRVSRATFSIDGTECSTAVGSTTVGLDHTFVADLIAELVAPDGTRIALMSRDGGSGNNLCRVVFDDTATRSIATAIAANAPYTGSWQPVEPLAAFVGAAGDGRWLLHVSDNAGIDTGSVRAFSLHLSGFVR